MLRSYLAVAGVTVATIAFSVATTNCGGDGATGGGGGTTTTSTTSSTTTSTGSGASAQPPGPPTSGVPGDGMASVTMAVSKLYLGDTDPDGTSDKVNGWKKFGYDLDGKQSTATSTDLCKPRDNASPKSIYPDGDEGRDNSFGKNILPIILGLASDATSKINEGIAGGSFTIMLDMQKLGSGANYTGIVTHLFAGGDLGAAPKFDGTDLWPVRPELLVDPMDITKGSKVSFPNAYVNNNTWVSGGKGNVTLSLSVSGFTLDLTIANAVITVEMDAAHQKGTKGVIAGVLNTNQLTTELKKVAGSFDPSLCSGPTIDSIVAQISQASDILADGTQDPTKTCDGISVGLGFDANIIKIGPIAPPSMPQPNPCGDAGP